MGYLLITTDIEPYYRDVISIMAQRYGCIYRFRYERKAGFDLVNLSDPLVMEHEEALVVLRCRETGQFIPIRRARIQRVFDSERLVVVRFAVLDFPDPTLKSQWPRIEQIVEEHGANSAPGKSLSPLVFPVSDRDIDDIVGSSISDDDRSGIVDVDRWTCVIDSVSHLSFASKSCFLHLHAIYEDDRNRLPRSRIEDGVLLAVSDAAYRLGIISYISTTDKTSTDKFDRQLEFSLALKSDDAMLSPIQDSSTVYSRYDDHTISFRSTEESGGLGSRITISPTGNHSTLYVPVIELPVYVRIAQWRWWSVAVALMAYLYSIFGIPSLRPRPSDTWAKLYQAVAVFVLVTMLNKSSVGFIWKSVWNSAFIAEFKRAVAEMRS